jgi:hypothetical protein
MKGANRTGRPFTGDYAGELLYSTLLEFGFAQGTYKADPNDGLRLVDCRICQRRCAACRREQAPAPRVHRLPTVPAGRIGGHAERQGPAGTGQGRARPDPASADGQAGGGYPFIHGRLHKLPTGLHLADSYHCSRYNTKHRPADDRRCSTTCSGPSARCWTTDMRLFAHRALVHAARCTTPSPIAAITMPAISTS